MVFAEVFMGLAFILLAMLVVRTAVRRYRKATVIGKMKEVQELEQSAGEIQEFQQQHSDQEKNQDTVNKFTSPKKG